MEQKPMEKNTVRNFVSDTTHFLRGLEDAPENNVSSARAAEEAKYKRVNALRDDAQSALPATKIWQGF